MRADVSELNILRVICDGLLSYDVGEHNWPILQQYVTASVSVPDTDTCRAMKWIYEQHTVCERNRPE